MEQVDIINELLVVEAQASSLRERCQKIRQALQPVSTGRSKKSIAPELVSKALMNRQKSRERNK